MHTVFLQAPSASSDQQEPTPEDRDQGFVADRGGTEQTSGEILLIEAYAAIWLILFIMMFLSLRRQRRLDERIGQLSADLEKARKESD